MKELAGYLREASPNLEWKRQRPDPPDFWLWQDGIKKGVEVTNIVDQQERSIDMSFVRLMEQTENLARQRKSLSGTYVMVMRSYLNSGRDRPKLQRSILVYIERTTRNEFADRFEIAIGGQSIGEIQKIHSEGARIISMVSTGAFPVSLTAPQPKLAQLLQTAIGTKAQKMSKSDCPWILVLYDLYFLATEALFAQQVRAVKESSRFELIYVVKEKGRGFPVLACDAI